MPASTHVQVVITPIPLPAANIGEPKRLQYALATDSIQRNGTGVDIILAAFAGGLVASTPPEIVLLLRVGTELDPILNLVRDELAARGVEDKHEVAYIRELSLTEAQVANIESSVETSAQLPEGAADQALAVLATQATKAYGDKKNTVPLRKLTQQGTRPASTHVTVTTLAHIQQAEQAEPILITLTKLKALRAATGTTITDEIQTLLAELDDLQFQDTASAAIKFVANGIVTVGNGLLQLLPQIEQAGYSPTAIASAIDAVGGMAPVLNAAYAGLIIHEALSLFRNVANVALLVNASDAPVSFKYDDIKKGERLQITAKLPPKQGHVYAVGFYLYKKVAVEGLSVGFDGSLVGLNFEREAGKHLSIGLSSPNLAPQNAATVVADSADTAAKAAETNANDLKSNNVTVAVADPRSPINYVLAFAD